MFKHHVIRSSLLQVWDKYSISLPKQRPCWIVPQEVIQFVAGSKEKQPHTYGDLIKFENQEPVMKMEDKLDKKLNWWFY